MVIVVNAYEQCSFLWGLGWEWRSFDDILPPVIGITSWIGCVLSLSLQGFRRCLGNSLGYLGRELLGRLPKGITALFQPRRISPG